jgi:DNA-binding response OmpR family regulator
MQPEPLQSSPFPLDAEAPRVVVADSDEMLRTGIARMLAARGYDVVVLRTGPQLLQYLYNEGMREGRPDLVICGAELEGIDGAQVCLIAHSQDNLLPFIVMAREGEAAQFDALELLDDACVVKRPVDLDELNDVVAQLAGEP